MSDKQERVSYLVGWLEGFSSTIWALVSTEDGAKLVSPETADEYDRTVKELRETLAERPIYDTGPYTVKTVPLSTPPIDFTPKITFKAGEDK